MQKSALVQKFHSLSSLFCHLSKEVWRRVVTLCNLAIFISCIIFTKTLTTYMYADNFTSFCSFCVTISSYARLLLFVTSQIFLDRAAEASSQFRKCISDFCWPPLHWWYSIECKSDYEAVYWVSMVQHWLQLGGTESVEGGDW